MGTYDLFLSRRELRSIVTYIFFTDFVAIIIINNMWLITINLPYFLFHLTAAHYKISFLLLASKISRFIFTPKTLAYSSLDQYENFGDDEGPFGTAKRIAQRIFNPEFDRKWLILTVAVLE